MVNRFPSIPAYQLTQEICIDCQDCKQKDEYLFIAQGGCAIYLLSFSTH